MSNPTQLERYKKLLSFLDEHFKERIRIEDIEEACYYSYRHINRIFEALHGETIGKYIKRLRLEKAAQYLTYSQLGVSDIAYEVGFEERAAFSKAFKNTYGMSPSTFRASKEAAWESIQQSFLQQLDKDREALEFEIEYLPDFSYIFLEYRGAWEDLSSIEKEWDKLIAYAGEKGIYSDASIFMVEILDDEEISEQINSRYNLALLLDRSLTFDPKGLFRTKVHQQQKYAKFQHTGSDESLYHYYRKIFAFWMLDVGLELMDLPNLEFYPNFEEGTPPEEILTEIYIPVA